MPQPTTANDWRESFDMLAQRVAVIERQINVGVPSPADFSDLQPDIVRITQELFPGEVSLCLLDDPEYPGDCYTVVEAKAGGEAEEVVQRRATWHKRMAELSDRCSCLRLTLSFEP